MSSVWKTEQILSKFKFSFKMSQTHKFAYNIPNMNFPILTILDQLNIFLKR